MEEGDSSSLGRRRRKAVFLLHKERAPLFAIMFSILWSVIPTSTSALSFNFSDFDQLAIDSHLKLEGDTSFNGTSRTIMLSKDASNMATSSRMTHDDPFFLWDKETRTLANFTTHFSFLIWSSYSSYGDGLTFFLAPYPSTYPIYSKGGFLGLFPNATTDAQLFPEKTVAVEFDTFPNRWDPPREHLGIDINNITSSVTTQHWNANVEEGKVANARVDYNADTHNLTVFLAYEETELSPAANYSLHLIVDLRVVLPETVSVGFSAATGNFSETHEILSWSFSSTELQKRTSTVHVGRVAGLAVAVAAALVLCFLYCILLQKKNRRWRVMLKLEKNGTDDVEDSDYDEGIEHEFEGGPKRFPFEELAAATRGFSEKMKLGEGGFGSVYKGHLNKLNVDVAIKRISRGTRQGKKQYISEVKTISRLRHRNLVQLIGWCHTGGEFLLVYEFMPNGSLDYYIHGKRTSLQWPVRHKIALGLASALYYLHEEWEQCVVHRDIKPSNVLLDFSFNAKLGDFGLARLVDHDHDLQTTDLAGTRAYMAPECFYTGKSSKESDVYSLGLVALQIACGRRMTETAEEERKVRLVEWVWELYGKNSILEAADWKLNGDFDERQMKSLMVVGLWCAHPDFNIRPSIKQVLSALRLEIPLPVLPRKRPVPTFSTPPGEGFSDLPTVTVVHSAYSELFEHSFDFTKSPSSVLMTKHEYPEPRRL